MAGSATKQAFPECQRTIDEYRLIFKMVSLSLRMGQADVRWRRLIGEVFYPAFNNELLLEQNDQAIFSVDAGRLAFTTDSFVVSPLFFPGGNIGDLAVNGTINDIALGGERHNIFRQVLFLKKDFHLKILGYYCKHNGGLRAFGWRKNYYRRYKGCRARQSRRCFYRDNWAWGFKN
jgi:hypothetical protein